MQRKRYKHRYTLSQFVCLLDVPPVRLRGTSLTGSRLPVLLTLLVFQKFYNKYINFKTVYNVTGEHSSCYMIQNNLT